jgi:hypothetical protein
VSGYVACYDCGEGYAVMLKGTQVGERAMVYFSWRFEVGLYGCEISLVDASTAGVSGSMVMAIMD